METDPQLLARLIKGGGRILVVGGGLGDLPSKFHEHPALVLWDDNRQGFQSKEVPQNTKAILYNRWVSHGTVARLNSAAQQLHALKYPMLRTRQIKELLSEIVAEERVLPVNVPPVSVEEIDTKIHQQEEQERMTAPQPVNKPERKGAIIGFVAKNLKLDTDWTEKGAMTREGQRIFGQAQKEGVSTTVGSVTECVRKLVKDLGKPTFGTQRTKPTPRVTKARRAKPKAAVATFRPSHDDDFAELDRLMEEALTAIKLIQEHLPKVRSETERLRGLRHKMLEMLK